jgi:hypothetical protein
MIHHKRFMATGIIVAAAIAACSDTMAPKELTSGTTASARSGSFRVEKNCSDYHGLAGETCTITSSTLKQIEIGSTITYASGADLTGFLNTDVVLDLPGPGNNTAFGHCELSLVTGIGVCAISGGTGKFTWFQATADVSPLGDLNFAWEGTYRFSPPN